MEKYVEGSMSKDEIVRVKAKFHWFVWIKFWFNFVFFGGVALACGVAGLNMYFGDKMIFAAIFGVIALVMAFYVYVDYLKLRYTEMACTNFRVIYKTGIVSLRTAEIKTDKIESIQIEQTFWGRIFGCGNIIFSGTGTAKVEFFDVSNPWNIKTKIEEAMADNAKENRKKKDDD